MEQSGFEQHLHDSGDAADPVQVRHHVPSAGTHIDDVRRPGADAVEVLQFEWDTRLLRNRQQVKHGVGRAARSHDHGNGVFKCLGRQNITQV